MIETIFEGGENSTGPTMGSPPPLPIAPTAIFYRIDGLRVSWREYLWQTKSPAHFLAIAIHKCFRIPIPYSTDDLNVQDIEPFETDASALNERAQNQMGPVVDDLLQLGFSSPRYHVVKDVLHHAETFMATLIHPSGQAIAHVHDRQWNQRIPPRKKTFVCFITRFSDGTFCATSNAEKDCIWPKSVDLSYLPREMSTAAVWEKHQGRLLERSTKRVIVPAPTSRSAIEAFQAYHAQFRDMHLRRKFFKPLISEDFQRQSTMLAARRQAEEAGFNHANILAEIRGLESRQSSPLNAVLILGASLLLFLARQRFGDSSNSSWRFIAIISGVLFVHESGHYLAMRLFGYRNLRMFFIPGFGAAVTGKNYNVPGWKKVIVSLMGPLPGIVIGAIVGLLGIVLHHPLCIEIGSMCVLINGFNLLPILPLDGGWSVHAILFSRHPLLDGLFRAAAGGLLAGAFVLTHDKFLLFLGIAVLMGVPIAYRNARIAAALRRNGDFPTASADDQTIPTGAAIAIINRLLPPTAAVRPNTATVRATAQRTLAIFETLNARPPSLAASLGLGTLHLVGCVAALLLGIMFIIDSHGGSDLLRRARMNRGLHTVSGAAITFPSQSAAISDRKNRSLIVATFKSQIAAHDEFDRLSKEGLTSECFGQSVLATFRSADDQVRRRLLARMRSQTQDVFVATPKMEVGMTLSCTFADTAQAEAIEHEINEYLQVPISLWAMAPWCERDVRDTACKARNALTRRTLCRLQQLDVPSPEQIKKRTELWTQMATAMKDGDDDLARQLKEQQVQLTLAIEQENLTRLHQDGSSVDPELMALYDSARKATTQPDVEEPQPILSATKLSPLASRFGPIEMIGGHPAPGADAWSATGFAAHDGNTVTMRFSCLDVLTFAPSIVRWLESQKASNIKYMFNVTSFGAGAWPDSGDAANGHDRLE